MRCKKNELAIVIKNNYGNSGKIVRCVRLATPEDWVGKWSIFGPTWVIDTPLLDSLGGRVYMCHDASLMPIRPSEGQDETLSWKDVPQGEYA
jgi:hypothetical protein